MSSGNGGNGKNRIEFMKENAEEKKIHFEVGSSGSQVKIKVIGVGGCGCNIVDSMYGLGIKNVEFYVINTDIQALSIRKCPNKLQIGADVTQGLGAGATPEVGEKSALSAKDIIKEIIHDADMIFITAGLGGGTGTGAAPIIASIAREMGILTVAFVTRPFNFEGPQRKRRAESGLQKLRAVSDTMIVISNEKLLEVVGKKATLVEAFSVANDVLAQGVQSISDLITVPGLINVDFADVKTIIGNTGKAVMGIGIGKGENRACEAIKKACASSLLDRIVIKGASGALVCFSAANILLEEIYQAMSLIYNEISENANIILGVVIDPALKDEVKVTIIATGAKNDKEDRMEMAQIPEEKKEAPKPVEVKPPVPEIKKPELDIKTRIEMMFSDEDFEKPAEAQPAENGDLALEIKPEIKIVPEIKIINEIKSPLIVNEETNHTQTPHDLFSYSNITAPEAAAEPVTNPNSVRVSPALAEKITTVELNKIKEDDNGEVEELQKKFEKAIYGIKAELEKTSNGVVNELKDEPAPKAVNEMSADKNEPEDIIDEVPTYLRRKRRFLY